MSFEDIAVKVSNLSKCYQIYDKPMTSQGLHLSRLQKLIRRKARPVFSGILGVEGRFF
jgi:hypothetical protein